ncbi:hypothetical protein I3760_16G058900 [Carya illinoinensis]|nr:hypothetical protein I3760_16G058900 [Carya illinoinensis]
MEEARRVLVMVAIFMFVLIRCGGAQQQVRLSSRVERGALLELRSSLGLRSKDWHLKADPCLKWVGVQCQNGRVVGISLSGLRRTRLGRKNPLFALDSLANFTLLQAFDASGFSLPGTIPDWFGNSFNALQRLDLRSCSVIGPIPPSLGNLRKLNYLYLSGNSLAGAISPALGQLSELLVLDLSRNTLTGSVPSSFESLGSLTRLDLSSNYLSEWIPAGLGKLSHLQYLNLSDNSFASSIPGQLGGLSQLVELDLSKNSLSGSLPVDLRGLRSLRRMNVEHNVLEGPLPDDLFMSLSSNIKATVAVFNLSNNQLYGSLHLSSLRKFRLVDLSDNYFEGMVLDASQTNATLDGNCLQVPGQRSLEDCRQFYNERGLSFEAPETSKTNKRSIYIMVGLFGGIGFIAIF